MKKYDLILNCKECNEYYVEQDRVIRYANNRLEANPDEKYFYTLPLDFCEAVRVIESFNESVKEVIIDDKNIPFYYKFMTYEDKIKHNVIVHYYLREIFESLRDYNLGINIDDIAQTRTSNNFIFSIILFDCVFKGQPLCEYIDEVKSTKGYKEYLLNLFINNPSLVNLEILRSNNLYFKELINNEWKIPAYLKVDIEKYHYVILHEKVNEEITPMGIGVYDKMLEN